MTWRVITIFPKSKNYLKILRTNKGLLIFHAGAPGRCSIRGKSPDSNAEFQDRKLLLSKWLTQYNLSDSIWICVSSKYQYFVYSTDLAINQSPNVSESVYFNMKTLTRKKVITMNYPRKVTEKNRIYKFTIKVNEDKHFYFDD